MTCPIIDGWYELYALGALEASEGARIDAHLLAGCPVCHREVEQARRLVAQLACLSPPAAPAGRLRLRLAARVAALSRGAHGSVN